uniref:Uncharacterized protein n=1 Tax=Elaeophora elaphi TaxID=1147741 RepID=A0A0R3RKF4_9BILA
MFHLSPKGVLLKLKDNKKEKKIDRINGFDNIIASSSVERQRNSKVGIVTQTDLSLVHISDQLSSYLNGLTLDSSIQNNLEFPEY